MTICLGITHGDLVILPSFSRLLLRLSLVVALNNVSDDLAVQFTRNLRNMCNWKNGIHVEHNGENDSDIVYRV